MEENNIYACYIEEKTHTYIYTLIRLVCTYMFVGLEYLYMSVGPEHISFQAIAIIMFIMSML